MAFKTAINDLFQLISLFKRRIYCNVDIFVYKWSNDLSNDLVDLDTIDEGLELISIDKSNLNYTNLTKESTKLSFYLEKGCNVFAAKLNNVAAGRCVSCELSSFKPNLYNNAEIFDVDAGYYIFFVRTFEGFRGKGVFKYMLNEVCHILAYNFNTSDILKFSKQGACLDIFISTDTKNRIAQKGIEKCGFIKLGKLRYLQILSVILKSEFIPIHD